MAAMEESQQKPDRRHSARRTPATPAKMFENDSIHAFHQKAAKNKSKIGAMGLPSKDKRDDFIMDTNSSSIVSKRSVEKLYYPNEPEYFRYFVRKFQRRSPLINRGYWLRMKAIDHEVNRFLKQDHGKHKIVVNLGCGYDPLPFQYLGKETDLCENSTFVDVDYSQLIQRKVQIIQQHTALTDLLPNFQVDLKADAKIASADKYLALGCDLRQLDKLDRVLRKEFRMDECSVAILFVAEVSVAYMEKEPANAVLRWAASYDDVRFCLLEQHLPDGPDHPFAETMLKHFQKLRTPLTAVGTMNDMLQRFSAAGWPTNGLDIKSLWELWSDPLFLTGREREALDQIEPFDEWEEFALFGSHYFLMVAAKNTAVIGSPSLAQEDTAETDSTPSQASPTQVHSVVSITETPVCRRFGASLPLPNDADMQAIGHHGGLGSRERLQTSDVYSTTELESLSNPPLPSALMCHTITRLGPDTTDCLLVGGRGSPGRASSACYLRRENTWTKVQDLPQARYRHCAVPYRLTGSSTVFGVLVFGGKTTEGNVLDDWLIWTPSTLCLGSSEWQRLELSSQALPEARFGCSMSLVYGKGYKGLLCGGMRKDGTIIKDCWEWSIDLSGHDSHQTILKFKNLTHELPSKLRACIGRFGAALVPSRDGMLLIGGIKSEKMLDRTNEIINIDNKQSVSVDFAYRPLLVGFSAEVPRGKSSNHESEVLLLGGGATCFSFGTFWNSSCSLRLPTWQPSPLSWNVYKDISSAMTTHESRTIPVHSSPLNGTNIKDLPKHGLVPVVTLEDASRFQMIRDECEPIVFRGLDIGTCTTLWTNQYLKDHIGADRRVAIHDSTSAHMNFQNKNFAYATWPFGELLDSADQGKHVYLRALSAEKPADKPTSLAEDYPSIASDFHLPPQLAYATANAHSSPLRVSGPVTMWLHYDVMANVLCQIRGSKTLLLYPPSDVTHLSFPPGASSSTINPFTASKSDHPGLGLTHPREAHLEPGDVLFIPPLWLHAATPTAGLSVAVNVFFKDEDMQTGYAAGKDVYGNRDLAAYERGRRDVQRVAKAFDSLPEQARRFYISRLADELAGMSLS